MTSVQLSGILPSIAGSGSAGTGGGDGLAVQRGPIQPPAPVAKSAGGRDAPAASPDKTNVNAAAPGADPALEVIGTQMVLVFDDQTHTMTVKMLDILTQKVVQQPPSAEANPAVRTPSGPATSGALIDTKA